MKRGEISAAAFVLMETILAVVVLALIGTIVLGLAQNTVFYENFFVKDNAHIIDALSAVPNGEMHVMYSLQAPEYELFVENGLFYACKNDKLCESSTLGGLKVWESKAFTRSALITEPQHPQFKPDMYEYVRKTSPDNSITIVSDFTRRECPGSGSPLEGMSVASEKTGFVNTNTDLLAQDVLAYVSAYRQQFGNQFSTSGPKIQFIFAEKPQRSLTVYYKGTSDTIIHLACVISRGASTPEFNVQYLNAIPEEYQRSADIIIAINEPYEPVLQQHTERIKQGIVQFWEI